MTFKIAKEKLAVIAGNKYFSIGYDYTRLSSSAEEVTCRVYVDGYHWYNGSTWEEALTILRIEMGIKPETIDENEEPKEEN